MPSRACTDYLYDIRDNALLARYRTADHTRESFPGNQQVFYNVTRCLEIVSEAGRMLPPELRDRHPELPWRAIMDAGNVYRHAYDNVPEHTVWYTVQQSLPPLLAIIESEITSIAAFSAAKPDDSIVSPAAEDEPPHPSDTVGKP